MSSCLSSPTAKDGCIVSYGKRDAGAGVEGTWAPGAAGVSNQHLSLAVAAHACLVPCTREVVCGTMTEWLMASLRKDATEVDKARPASVGNEGDNKASFRHTKL
jgi:hypothetical protein